MYVICMYMCECVCVYNYLQREPLNEDKYDIVLKHP